LSSEIILVYSQASFPVGMPGNGLPSVILAVGTAFKLALGELYKKHPFAPKLTYSRFKI